MKSILTALTLLFGFICATPVMAAEKTPQTENGNKSDRYAAGLAMLEKVSGEDGEKVVARLQNIAPDFARYTTEFFGDIYSRPGLDLKKRELAVVASLTALGTAAPQLKVHIGAALNVGCTQEEIVETIMTMGTFAGFPAALNGLFVAEEVFAAHPSGAAQKKTRTNAAPHTENKEALDRYARGLAMQRQVSGQDGTGVVERLNGISPDFARYMVEFFGDIYSRPGLDLQSREIAVVAALTALGNATPQLKVHIAAAINVGCTHEEIVEVIMQMGAYAGFPAALNGLFAAEEVFAARNKSAANTPNAF